MKDAFKIAFWNLIVLRGFFYALILTYASIVDIRNKIIPDKVHVLIILLSLCSINSFNSIIGFFIVPLPFLITAFIKGDGIGGGDIKFMAANGLFLGLKGGFIGSFIGLTIAVLINIAYYKIKNKDKEISFPLAPYLSIGCVLTYVLF